MNVTAPSLPLRAAPPSIWQSAGVARATSFHSLALLALWQLGSASKGGPGLEACRSSGDLACVLALSVSGALENDLVVPVGLAQPEFALRSTTRSPIIALITGAWTARRFSGPAGVILRRTASFD